ncbi:copper resistance protein B [Aurantiacibacter zhengii]|jgi:copper resistance protein B|uniref:Copper resistance protein B n=1 Tax=Aurantiacibacter zhengii TaxID=2307003 RepID=A0A418NPJ0_9SPHN|nr:copper resistance protein B [Aurantiacibacter zhengii]RIV84204.1 copper resistance protein B [Aurantiacibacter zhengii]
MKMHVLLTATSVLAGVGTPAFAQDHSDHASHRESAATECEKEAERHRAMGHAVPEGQCEPPGKPATSVDHSSMDQQGMDHGQMDHGQSGNSAMDQGSMDGMDHSQMDHGQGGSSPMDQGSMEGMDHGGMDHGQMDMGAMDHGSMAMPIPEAPPPAAAGSGPPRAADAIWGAEAMREAREQLRREQGGQTFLGIFGDRLEYRAREGEDGYLWDFKAWYGGDLNRVWVESEGEGAFGEGVEDADISLLYGRAIGPWFDLQAGVRQDLTGPTRTYLDLGIQGLAPYLFEVEADVFLSDKGDVTATAEVELDQRITQRLILQPRGEISLAAQDVPELGIGAGIDTIEAGVRLRYEFAREFAPYIGVEQEWKIGDSADFARAAGEDPSVTNYVVGLRFWF